jgi:prepilin-type N-terminal cleavage/methylation domain-containing protein
MHRSEKGFTLIEFAVVLSALAVGFVVVCSGCTGSMDKAREDQLRDNIFTIQTAILRYGTDHNDAYPAYLIGGDQQGWNPVNGCLAISRRDEAHRPPLDPLIAGGYLASYPKNPFIGPGGGVRETIAKTGASRAEGAGDVRFGWDGTIMGNCLDDPRYLFNGPGDPSKLQYTMLNDAAANIGVLREGGRNSFYCMGGLPGAPKETVRAWWPGQFMYRARGTFGIRSLDSVHGDRYHTIWGWTHEKVNRYILGGYGSLKTEGWDIIRLTTKRGSIAADISGSIAGYIPNQYYEDHWNPNHPASHPSLDFRILYCNPEVMGGGEFRLMPMFPYYYSRPNAWIYGAPDGYADGVVIVYTSAGYYQVLQEEPE